MRIDGSHDEAVLHAMGADRIEEVRDGSGALIGYDVAPDIDIAGYEAASAQLASQKSGMRWDALRAGRDRLLARCDWTQGVDSPLGVEVRAAWATYRKALRDLPANTADPTAAAWPTPPAI